MKTTTYSLSFRMSLTVVVTVGTMMLGVVGCSSSEADKSTSGSFKATGAATTTPVAPEVKAQMDASRQADAARHAALAEQMSAPKK